MTTKRTVAENLAFVARKAVEAKARIAGADVVVVVNSKPKAITLPLWPDSVRGVPNSILRSALFGVIRRGPRAYLARVKKATVDGVTIIHSGPTLDQADLDVWEQCLHLARTSGLGTRIEFSTGSFLKAIGRSMGAKTSNGSKAHFQG